MNTTIQSGEATATTDVSSAINTWIRNPNVDVMYKTLALIAVLLIFGLAPATRKFATFAAWAVLLVLLVQP